MKNNRRKRIRLKVSCIVFITFSIITFSKVRAQESIFDYLSQALTKIVASATIVNLANYDYVSGNCLYGVYLSEGESQSLIRHFEKGVDYYVLGAGDDDIIDMDLALLSTTGEVLIEDTDDDATPILQFTPNYSGKMTLKITNYNSTQDGFCVMVILRESYSGNFSLYQIGEALDNVIQNSQVAYLFSSRFARGTFCLFGGRLNERDGTYLYNMQPSPGRYALVGAGSDNISDVDLFVVRQRARGVTTGAEIAKDEETDNRPICTFTVYSGYHYLLRHKNYSSYRKLPGFVFSVLLRL
jgi:hypothetical protein